MEKFDLIKFKELPSYRKRILYAEENLERLSSGSARIIYIIDNDKVLKLAKNKKGLAQNMVEADGFIAQSYSDIVASVLDYDQDDLWIVSQRAKPISKKRFKELLGFTVNDLYSYICNIVKNNIYCPYDVSDEIKQQMDEVEFIQEFIDMIMNLDMEIGDFNRINSYGEIKGDLVITDYGLTKAIYNEYYKRR